MFDSTATDFFMEFEDGSQSGCPNMAGKGILNGDGSFQITLDCHYAPPASTLTKIMFYSGNINAARIDGVWLLAADNNCGFLPQNAQGNAPSHGNYILECSQCCYARNQDAAKNWRVRDIDATQLAGAQLTLAAPPGLCARARSRALGVCAWACGRHKKPACACVCV